MKLPRLALAITILAAAGAAWTATRASTRLCPPENNNSRAAIVFVQAPVVHTDKLVERFPQGSRLVRLDREREPKSVVNLTEGFFAAADPQVSFDGTKILFAAQQARGSNWQIWEMNADGSGKRQVSRCGGDCLQPAYLARGEIVYTSVIREGSGSISQLHVSQLDGSGSHPITFGPGNFQVETVLQNGRILVSALSPLVPGVEKSRELYTLRPDGSGLAPFRCDHRQSAVRTQAEELEDGTVVFVKLHGGAQQAGGELAQIRRGALHNSAISPARAGQWSPRKLSPDRLVVARNSSSGAGNLGKFDLYGFDAKTGRFAEVIFRDAHLSSVQAVPVAAHPAPRWYWSTVSPKADAGYFVSLNSYLSSDAPQGRIATPIAAVRVLVLDPSTNRERALGSAPVEPDGSFYIAVPPDSPVRFELLDASGAVIRAQRSWIWARPGEERGCVGCHEDRAIAPENRWPQALRRFDTPTRLGLGTGPGAEP